MREFSLRLGGIGLMWFGWTVLMYILWIRGFYGFHHDYALGVFAWLLIGEEDGFVVMPNPCGIVLNGLLTAFGTWASLVASKKLARTHNDRGDVTEENGNGT